MAIELVDFASYKMVIFHSYVCLPEARGFFFLGQLDTINQDSEQTQHGDIITITITML
jgi:hypothetical protein